MPGDALAAGRRADGHGRRRPLRPVPARRVPRRLARGTRAPVRRGGARTVARSTSTSGSSGSWPGCAGWRRRPVPRAGTTSAAARRSDPDERAEAVEAYSAAFVAEVRPPPDVGPILAELAARFPLAVLSNWPLAATIDRFVAEAGWAGYFQAIVVSQRVGAIKPSPEIFAVAADGARHGRGADPPRRRRLAGRRRRGQAGRLAGGVPARPAGRLAAAVERAGRLGPAPISSSTASTELRSTALDGVSRPPGRAVAGRYTRTRWRYAIGWPTSRSWRPRSPLGARRHRRHDARSQPRPGCRVHRRAGFIGARDRPDDDPALLARRRSPAIAGSPIAATGSGPRGAAAGSAIVVALFVGLRLQDALQLPDRPVRRHDGHRRRSQALDRRLTASIAVCHEESSVTVFDPATRPAEPAADAKRAAGEAVAAARAEIIALEPRDPRAPRAGLRGAPGGGLGRRGDRAARLRGRAPGGQPRDRGPRSPARRPRRRRAADRDPRRVRRAARPRSRLRSQHDGRVGGRRGDRPGVASPPSCPARSCSSAARPRSAAAARHR